MRNYHCSHSCCEDNECKDACQNQCNCNCECEDDCIEEAAAGVILSSISVVGAFAVGALIGVLFAPQPGEKTRKDLQHKAEEIGKEISKEISNKVTDLQKSLRITKNS